MKILLTGGTGFVGQHIYHHLQAASHEIVILSRKTNCDLLDYRAVSQFVNKTNPEVLVHLAWDVTHGEYWTSPQNDVYKKASIHLFESFLQNGPKKIIGAGTCAEYPPSNKAMAEDYSVDYKRLTPYGRAKREVFEWLVSHCNDFTWFRIFGVYGNGENPNRFFPKVLKAIQNDESFHIQTPDVFYDYVSIEKIAEFVVWAIKNKGIGAVNMGTGVSHSMQEWHEFIKYDYHHVGVQSDVKPHMNSHIANCEKLIQSYGDLNK